MIVREIRNYRDEVLERFDYFNDYKGTRLFCVECGLDETVQLLDEGWNEFIQDQRLKTRVSFNNMKPISPKEIKDVYGSGVPTFVIEVVNDLLKKKVRYEGQSRFTLKQSEVVEELISRGIERSKIFSEHYLDFEPEFRKAGWKVTWNKGAYYELESASYWEFKA